jgi:hypothetical protein
MTLNPAGSAGVRVECDAFEGQHCETTATGTLLNHLGLRLSEPMLFGLGEGLGFIYWKTKSMEFPFIGGRVKPDVLTANLARNLGLNLIVRETASAQTAWDAVTALLAKGRVVGLKLDSYHLEYFPEPIHFAGHYVALYGYDATHAYLVDTIQQGGRVKTSLASLAAARAEKGPMSSRNLYYVLLEGKYAPDVEQAVRDALRANAREYLNPPINNIGWKGLKKAAAELPNWFANAQDRENEFGTTAMLMERAGTGGALFRNLYRDFLGECRDRVPANAVKGVKAAHAAFIDIAPMWTRVSELLAEAAGARGNRGEEAIGEACAILLDLAEREKRAMQALV